jgi:hypothetical protein
MIPVLINNRDLLASVQAQVRFFRSIPDTCVVLVDQASTYPPLLEWYLQIRECSTYFEGISLSSIRKSMMVPAVCYGLHDAHSDREDMPHFFFPSPINRGPRGSQYALAYLAQHEFYYMSEPDLDYSECPIDIMDCFHFQLHTRPSLQGVGVHHITDDLPRTPLADMARTLQPKPSQLSYDSIYPAPCDTAGVMRRAGGWNGGYEPGLRSLRHSVRHLPWYFVDKTWTCPTCGLIATHQPRSACCPHITTTPPDFAHYFAHADPRGTAYTSFVLDKTRQ